MRKYELVIIVKILEEEALDKAITKVENLINNNGGNIEKTDRWGKRRLAYEVKDMMEGFYVVIYFNGQPATVKELDRVIKITDDILKFMIVKADE